MPQLGGIHLAELAATATTTTTIAPQFIETIRKQGDRLISSVDILDE